MKICPRKLGSINVHTFIEPFHGRQAGGELARPGQAKSVGKTKR